MSKSEAISYMKYAYQFVMNHQVAVRLILAVIFLIIGIFGAFVIGKITGIIHNRLAKFMPRWLQILNESFRRPIVNIIRTLLIYLFIMLLPLPDSLSGIYPLVQNIFVAVCVAFLGIGFWNSEALCGLLLTSAQDKLDAEDTNNTMTQFFVKIYRAIVFILTILTILEIFGVPVGGIIAGAGVVGLAVSLACQSTFSSLIAGIALVIEQPFAIGDYIQLGEYSGTVKDISFRSTRIYTLDNLMVTIENSQVTSQYIMNYSRRDNRLITFDIGVRYDTPADRIRDLCADMVEGIEQDPAVVPGTAHIAVTEFASHCINLNVRVYVTTLMLNEYRDTQGRINLLTMDIMDKNNCEFAFPSTSIYMEPRPDEGPEEAKEAQENRKAG